MAWDYRFDRADKVLKQISEHYLRDLPIQTSFPYSPYRLTHGASTEGAKTPARSAVMLNRILEARNWEKLLAQATPEEEAVLEACLPDLLQLQHERKEAQIRSSQAYNTMRRFRVTHRFMQRCYPAAEATPSQTHRVNGMRDLSVEACHAYEKAKSAFEVADLMFRRARGFPLARRRNFNRRRYKLAPGRKRFRRWWERVKTRKAVSDLRRGFKRPPRWCDLCPGGLVYFHVASAYAFGRVVPFSLNLTRELETRARLKPLPAAWFRDQIARRVKQRLGHSVELLVSLEVNKAGKLHAHGVMAPVRLIEEGEVGDALRLAGGKGYHGRQVDVGKNQPDSGWASYMAKDYNQPFAWTRFAATSGLRTSAEDVFEKMRAFVLEHQDPVPPSSALSPTTR